MTVTARKYLVGVWVSVDAGGAGTLREHDWQQRIGTSRTCLWGSLPGRSCWPRKNGSEPQDQVGGYGGPALDVPAVSNCFPGGIQGRTEDVRGARRGDIIVRSSDRRQGTKVDTMRCLEERGTGDFLMEMEGVSNPLVGRRVTERMLCCAPDAFNNLVVEERER